MKFLVTGCSRSGTAYTAKLLSKAGIPCKHERVFNISRLDRRRPAQELPFYDEPAGESSFLAVPFLDELPTGTIVLHQVRHPVDVVRSHAGMRFFATHYEPSIYLAFNHPEIVKLIGETCPDVLSDEVEIKRCMRYWTLWNRAIKQRAESRHRYVRYHVEDLDLGLFDKLATFIASERPRDLLQSALHEVSRSTNSRPRDDSVSWHSLPDGPEKDEMAELALEYGYRVE